MKTFIVIILTLNLLWFVAAFNLFSMRSATAAKLLLRRENRIDPFPALVAQLTKFLGGMNLALAIFAAICLFEVDGLLTFRLNYAICLVFFVAHMSQFVYNVPLALKEKKGESSHWAVLTGTMFFIFVGDAFLAVCNLVLAVCLLVN